MVRPGTKALAISTILVGLQLALWYYLVLPSLNSSSDFRHYAAEHLGDLVQAAAITFYVVFTYYLLQNTDFQRRRLSEPLLAISWSFSRDATEQRLTQFQELGRRIRTWFSGSGDAGVSIEPVAQSEDRFVVADLLNLRDIQIAWIEIDLSLSLSMNTGTGQSAPILYQLRENRRFEVTNLRRDEIFHVTVADLHDIPVSTVLDVTVDEIRYSSVDDVTTDHSQGQRAFRAPGIAIMRSMAPTPVSAAAGGGEGAA